MPDINALKKLVSAHGVSGGERNVAEVIREMITADTDEIHSDAMGNLIARKKGAGKRIMLSAHMDSIGMIVTFIEKEGYLRFSGVGYLDPYEILHAAVIFGNGTKGLIAAEQKADRKALKLENLYIDIGAGSVEDAGKLVSVGDTASFAAGTFEMNGLLVSPGLDDRIGCLVLIEALKEIKDNKNDLWFVFSAQEEVGLRGAVTAAYAIEPEYALAVDVTDTGDTPEVKIKMDCSLGRGPAIKLMDSSVLCHPEVVEILRRAAKGKNIPYQNEVMTQGGTDAGAIHTARGGVRTGALSIPARYMHTPCETVNCNDVDECVRLLVSALELF